MNQPTAIDLLPASPTVCNGLESASLPNSANSETSRILAANPTLPPLQVLSERINDSYRRSLKHAKALILEARECGDLLNEAKKHVRHGDWLSWLRRNFEGSEDTAENWMKIAANWGWLKYQVYGPNVLTVDKALKLLRAEKIKQSLLSVREKQIEAMRGALPEIMETWEDSEVDYLSWVFAEYMGQLHKEVALVVSVLQTAEANYEAATARLKPFAEEAEWKAAEEARAEEIGKALRPVNFTRLQRMLLCKHLPKGCERKLPRHLTSQLKPRIHYHYSTKEKRCTEMKEGPEDWV